MSVVRGGYYKPRADGGMGTTERIDVYEEAEERTMRLFGGETWCDPDEVFIRKCR